MRAATLAFLVAASSYAAPTFTRSPFAQRATGTDVIVKWAASGGATVTYGPKGGVTMTATEASTASNRHELKLTGLQPSTRYAYTVDLGGTTASGEFSTAAAPGESFSFIVYGDNRTNNSDHQSVVDAIKKESVDFLVETGDVVEYPLQSYYDTYFGIEKDLLAQNVLFPTLGNHEYGAGVGTTLWKQQFSVQDVYYSFDWGNARFVVLDFNANSSAQATWLDGVLADARAKGIEHLFAFMHHSPYDSGNHGANSTAAKDWVPVFQKYNLDMIFGGHDHDYERGMSATTGLRYLVTGGGGAPLYSDNSKQAYQEKFESALHYVKVSIAGSMVTVTALHTDGSQLDTVSWSTASTAPDMGVAPDLASGSTTTGGTTGSTTGGTTGSTTGGTTGSTTGGSTTGSTTGGGSTGGSATTGGMPSNASGGCAIGGPASTSFGLLFALALLLVLRRRAF